MKPSKLSRRAFVKVAATASMVGLSGIAISGECTNELAVSRFVFRSPALPSEFEGFKIGLLSDIHLGREPAWKLFNESLAAFKDEALDLLVLGGDFVWLPEYTLTREAYGMASWLQTTFGSAPLSREDYCTEILAMIEHTVRRAGVARKTVAVVGNHEQRINPLAAPGVFTARSAVELLMNRTFVFERGGARLTVIGTDDLWTGCPRIPVGAEKDPAEFRVLAAHNPDYLSFTMNETATQFDLGLAGHTHGGQVHVPFFGRIADNVRDWRLAEGFYRNGPATTYTTRGTGSVAVPLRINCPPEAVIFELRRDVAIAIS